MRVTPARSEPNESGRTGLYRAEKHRRRETIRRFHDTSRPMPSACATGDVVGGRDEKRLSVGQNQAMFTLVGTPLEECCLKGIWKVMKVMVSPVMRWL